jgi:hypothetical protein
VIARLLRPGALAGLLFAVFGAGVVALAAAYPPGTMQRMGPGWLPRALGWTLIALGAGIAIAALPARRTEDLPPRDLRPLACLLAAVGAFAALLEPAGLVAAIIACVAIARLAERPYRPVETAALAAFLAALGAGVFVLGLGLPIPLFGR